MGQLLLLQITFHEKMHREVEEQGLSKLVWRVHMGGRVEGDSNIELVWLAGTKL